eukprot:TRINITY_DN13671_c0_g1_i5.p1 TRINITY_DN13671_c0_g1~~TRINITY_DN13671_c0_g1_i5.p1  ORF type:complete len:272 (-),score=54.47 TRINITY_DN13671_c0_g1_i5:12-827(-)
MRDFAQASFKTGDCTKGWINFVASAFQADMHGIAVSGTGAVWDSDGNKKKSMRNYYTRTLYSEEKVCEKFEPMDLIVMYLGCNDYEGCLQKHTNRCADFVVGYSELLALIRKTRPDCPILCLIPGPTSVTATTSKAQQAAASKVLQKLIPKAVENAGGEDNSVFWRVNPATHDLDDDSQWGSLLHWNVKGHMIFAEGAIEVISEVMGWKPSADWKIAAKESPLYEVTSSVTTKKEQKAAKHNAKQKQRQAAYAAWANAASADSSSDSSDST